MGETALFLGCLMFAKFTNQLFVAFTVRLSIYALLVNVLLSDALAAKFTPYNTAMLETFVLY